jgi:hypothetical protein
LNVAAPVDGATPLTQKQADRSRIQAHLELVEGELRARDVGDLPLELQRARALNLHRLHAYWTAGEFPHNDDFLDQRVPYFIDDAGTACAVGHLVIESGFADVAEEIRKRQNNAKLLDMTHPALPGWIAASGLTAEECARIQPTYCGCTDEYAPVCGADGQSYANRCYAETCAGVDVAHEGECEPETSGDWPPAGSSTGETGDEPTGTTSTDSTGAQGSTGASEDGSDDGPQTVEKKSGCTMAPAQTGWTATWLTLVLLSAGRRRRGAASR